MTSHCIPLLGIFWAQFGQWCLRIKNCNIFTTTKRLFINFCGFRRAVLLDFPAKFPRNKHSLHIRTSITSFLNWNFRINYGQEKINNSKTKNTLSQKLRNSKRQMSAYKIRLTSNKVIKPLTPHWSHTASSKSFSNTTARSKRDYSSCTRTTTFYLQASALKHDNGEGKNRILWKDKMIMLDWFSPPNSKRFS